MVERKSLSTRLYISILYVPVARSWRRTLMPMRLSMLGVRIPERVLRPPITLSAAAVLIGGLVCLEWNLNLDVSLGIFYAFPIALAALALNRWQILCLAILCAYLRGLFTTQHAPLEAVLRFLMATFAYIAVGLLVAEMSRNRRVVMSHYANLKIEQELRRHAQEQLRFLADSSPAAILTLDHNGDVIAANRATHEILGVAGVNALIGRHIGAYVPTLASAIRLPGGARQVRTSAWTWAKHSDGTMFPIATWFSTYGEGDKRHLAAIVVDISEEVRDREMENFRHVLDYNRLLAGTVSHEIRNLCSAVAVVASNLGRRPDLETNADFQALNQLIAGLSRLASFELHARGTETPKFTSLASVLDNLRIVIETDWKEIDGVIKWHLPEELPEVHGDSHGILQIFLNLAQNSLRAVEDREVRELTVDLVIEGDVAIVRFIDSGPGIPSPEALFQPFRSGSESSGLGLYISRALARSFDGDLTFVPQAAGCRFDVTLRIRRHSESADTRPVAGQADSPVYR